MIRKDGMLLFNLHQGALLQGMTAIQLLLLVFLVQLLQRARSQ